MCTVTVRSDSNGVLLTMNRDEALRRAAEHPPVADRLRDGTQWIGPRDGLAGGSWIGVSAHGAIAALLNCYDADLADTAVLHARPPSRGVLVPMVLGLGQAPAIRRWLREAFDPRPFRPFHLVVLDATGGESFTWRGESAQQPWAAEPMEQPWALLTSSSWNGPEVCEWRRAEFGDWLSKGAPFIGSLPAFHLMQHPGREEWGPLVKRALTTTRSITQIRIDAAGGAALKYWPEPVPEPAEPALCLSLEITPQPQGEV